MTKTFYKNGAIIAKDKFLQRINYEIVNNKIAVQFDGRGCASYYCVANGRNMIELCNTVYGVDGICIDEVALKTVTMIGKRQVVEYKTDDFTMKLTCWLDEQSNAIYERYILNSKKACEFSVYRSYEYEFRHLTDGKINEKELSSEHEIAIIPTSGYIHKISTNGKAIAHDYNIYEVDMAMTAGDTCELLIVSSIYGQDCDSADVNALRKNYLANYERMIAYESELIAPPSCNTEFLKSYYSNLYNCCLSTYREYGTFKGFLAGLVYQTPVRTYFRDGYWTILSVIDTKPQLVREEILTLAGGVSEDGRCPSAVKYDFSNWWGDHYDSPSLFIILIYDYVRKTGDKKILDTIIGGRNLMEIIKSVLDNLEQKCDESGMLYKGGEFNCLDWCDNVSRTGYVTYDECLYARALKGLAFLTGDLSYKARYDKICTLINTHLWDESKGYYVNYRDIDFVEDNLSIDTIVAVLFGIADREKSLRILKNMEDMLECRNNPLGEDYGVMCVYPFYKNAKGLRHKSSKVMCYHNGADWPYWSALYAYAKHLYNLDYEYPLTQWFKTNIARGNYTPVEFFDAYHKDGSLMQAWSSVGAFVLQHLDKNYFA